MRRLRLPLKVGLKVEVDEVLLIARCPDADTLDIGWKYGGVEKSAYYSPIICWVTGLRKSLSKLLLEYVFGSAREGMVN